MAGLFNFINYSRPGPGVSKDEPQKPRIILFFQIYLRRFWDIVKLNMLFSLFNLPALLAVVFLLTIFLTTFEGLFLGGVFFKFSISLTFCAAFLSIPVITTGPAQAGFTYVLKNYVRQEHAFLWWDFKEHALNNFKQSLIISIIDLFVMLFIFVDIYIYVNAGTNSLLISISVYLVILFFVIFLMMHLYIYPLLVSFELSLSNAYKNAFIFATVKFFPNLGILLLCFAVSSVTFLIVPIVGLMLFPLITLGTIGFITNFYVYPTIEKHMIKKF